MVGKRNSWSIDGLYVENRMPSARSLTKYNKQLIPVELSIILDQTFFT